MAREKAVDKSSQSTKEKERDGEKERERENKYCRSYSMDSQVKTYIFEKSVVGDFQPIKRMILDLERGQRILSLILYGRATS